MNLPDLPSVAEYSLKRSCYDHDRKCFYYFCNATVYCKNSNLKYHSPYKTAVSPSFDHPLREIIETRCNSCTVYCLYHISQAEARARAYGPVNCE